MGLQLEYQGMKSAEHIGLEHDAGYWPNADEGFLALEHAFAICFLIELVLRFAVMGCGYFKQVLNWMDFIVVAVSVMELYVIPIVGAKTPDMGVIRLLRVCRVLRVLRMVRVLKLLPKLRVLVVAVSHSCWSLIWSMLLLGLVEMIGSIFMTMSLQSYLQDEDNDPQERANVYTYFGSFSRSCITMFEITLAGGTWGRCGRIVIFSVSRFYAIFFLGYLGMVSFAMIRVISAIFLKDTLNSSSKDGEAAMAEENKDPKYVKKVWTTFQMLDTHGTGTVSIHELPTLLQDPKTYKAVDRLGVEPHEVPGLFTLMDDGDDEVDFCEFLAGIMRLKNVAKGLDLATILYENKKLLKRVMSVGYQVDELREICMAKTTQQSKQGAINSIQLS
eukprot:gnl/MRDRNA2_/MRDRNA2_79700_c0_seq2.p1 gnl/MRDRNA2_/MRDRNA2_79700_c0~~gnl/MRDRNA2_/MRDRNA2_79700_c0_seq2.p1  ORF type:complete len:427 (+),score=59.20 gnl/MRDRNA2_/MRDRNA2_79700_c0_seq2:120-1283(+)